MTNQPPRGIERRRLRRVLKQVPVAFEAGCVRGRGHIKNLSKGGVFVRTDRLPDSGDDVRILFHDRKGSKIEVLGIVAWTTDQLPSEEVGPSGFGMRFSHVPDEYLEFFEQVLTH
jgi:uncharacterized protein (TIGR02266 family)